MAAGLSVSVSGGGVYNTSHSITLTAIPSGNATGPFTYQWFNLYSSMPMNSNPATWDLMPIGGGNSQTVSIVPYPGYYWYQVLVTSAPQHTGYWSDFRINLSQNISNSGIFTVRLDDMGQPNSQGISPAVLTCYVGGNAVGTYTLYPGQYTMCKSSPPVNFTSGTSVGEAAGIQLDVINTTAGLYAYQKYAYISFVTPMVASAGTPLTVQNATNSISNPYNYTFTGTWNGQRETLTWVPNHTVENMSDASVVGEITDFQTADPKYTCLNGETIYVWTAPSEYPGEYVVHNGDMGAQCTYLTLTFPESASNSTTPNPYNYTFTGTFNGQSVVWHWVPNHTIEGLADASLVGEITNFQTADPKYTCLNGETIYVWTAPSEYPGEYVVHNGDMGAQCTYLTLTVNASSLSSNSTAPNPYDYNFTGTFNGQTTSLHWVPNHTIEGLADAQLVGEMTNFQTADPKYTCLNGETIYVWTAPSEYPGEYVVHNGDMGAQCTYLTLTFNESAATSNTPNPYNYTFTGTWNGQRETLAWVPNHTIENMSDATLVGTISNFQTADPKYTCLNGEDINVWTAPSEYPGEYVVHNGDMGPQCTYLTLIFPESSNSIGFNVNIYPQIQVITLNESAMLLSTVNGGALPYTYQWYGQESGNSYSQIPGATYSDYLFTPYAHGVYNFELYATDATGKTVPSSPVEVVVVTEYTPVTINVTNENTELGISNTPHVILNLKKENSTVSVTHANNTAIDSTLSISNVTSSSPAAPPNTTKLLSLNVSTPASNISINFTMHYNCNVPSSKVSPYILNNGKWDRINNYTIDAAACTVTFHLNKDPVVALIENNSTSSSSTSPGSGSGAASGTGGVSSELSSTVVDLVAVVIVVAAVLIGLALVLGKKGKGKQQQTAGK